MDRRSGRFARWPSLFIPVFIAVWLLVAVLGDVTPVYANLPPSEAATFEECLNRIAQGVDVQADHTTCDIIINKRYLPSDFTEFFRDYFSDHVFNQRLWEFLIGHTFWGQGNEVTLQTGFIPVFEELITRIVAAHPTDLGPALAQDSDLRETLLNAHRMFAHMAHYGNIGDADRQGIFAFYLDHINTYPQYWKKSTTIDVTDQPYVGALAAQIHSNLRDIQPLTDASKTAIAEALDLQGRYLDIWQEFSVLLYDNNGFDAAQREYIYRFFTLNPKELVVVAGISQMEMLGNGGNTWLPILLGGVNVFPTRVGELSENPFPRDGAYRPCDLFGTVVAHEVTHTVFASYVEKNSTLKMRHNWLIQQAGYETVNYLRGGAPGFFYENPQEFLASLANQWFCSSADTVQLGVDRFLRGNPHGINQALYFAEVMSVGGDQTWLYTNDPQGNLTRQAAAITRDDQGYINSIALPGVTYRFGVNGDAMVTRLWKEGASYELDPANGLTDILKPGETKDLQFTVRNTGNLPLQTSVEPLPEGVAGKRGALQVDGSSWVRVNSSDSLNPTEQLTVEAWLYPLTWENTPLNNRRILQKGHHDNQYRLVKEGDALVFDLENVGELRVTGHVPPSNRWSHIAGVYDGKALRLYVNGELVGQKAASGQIATTDNTLAIGSKDIRGAYGFWGYIDTVRIWSVGRTQAQIKAGMTNSVTGQTGLVGDWRFNTPGSGPVEDNSPNQNNGILYNAAHISAPDGPYGLMVRLDWWGGELLPGQSQVVTLHIDAKDTAEGTYFMRYQVQTNGMSQALSIPVTIEISNSLQRVTPTRTATVTTTATAAITLTPSPTHTPTPTLSPSLPPSMPTPTTTEAPQPEESWRIYLPDIAR